VYDFGTLTVHNMTMSVHSVHCRA